MKNKKALNVLLGVLALLLVVGMAYQFTPNVGSLFGGGDKGTPAMTVNGETVTVQDLEALRQSNPVLSSAQGGTLADDFKTYVVAQQARQVALRQAAQDIDVSRADVNAEVDKIRESNGLTDNKAWTDALQGLGLTDATFREQVRDQLAVNRKVEEIKAAAPAPSDAEVRLHYDLNPESYQTDARIVGRQIVVSDKAKAEDLLRQIRGGADFAGLASANSTEFKDRGGALGPVENGKPRPVAQVALPSEVGAAAFALTEGGVTDVVESGGKFYIVQVEDYLAPAVKPFEQAKADAQKTVAEQKKNRAVEEWFSGIEKNIKVEVTDPNWKTENPTVAAVAGQEIPYSAVVEQVVQNEQFTSLLGQVPAEQAGQLVNSLLKPQITDQLIQAYAAPQVAQNLKLALTGTRQEQAAGLVAYGGRDVEVTDAEVRAYYTQNRSQFETPASATVAEVSFPDQAKATAFRQSFAGGDPVQAAARAGGAVSERGEVSAGSGTLGEEVEAAVFGAENLKAAGQGRVSDVVKVGERYVVAHVTGLTPAVVLPLAEVRDQIREQVLATKRSEAGQKFLTDEVAKLKPENNLQAVLDAQEKRVAAAAPPPAPAGQTGGSEEDAAQGEGAAAEDAAAPADDAAGTDAQTEAPAEGETQTDTPAETGAPATE
ncbi:peptidyl-prolyl cis-trans isomerase [Deinococcus sp. SDU3-2]|uniref:peptidylprolyl isomerase n=1 Tax=Deinococcus terrestris TaxID=2651870 RepID=A0A7X1TQE5_9DEIO|nr:peptidyl-prolyl cis-trans isomerase [Deinococcus terrestris]MPY65214.1 peptidyl-prolyl cis-trans isomerase [Deinococcus terrestris]